MGIADLKPEEVEMLQTKSLDELMHLLEGRKQSHLAESYSAEFLRQYSLAKQRREEKRARRRLDKLANTDNQLTMFKDEE